MRPRSAPLVLVAEMQSYFKATAELESWGMGLR